MQSTETDHSRGVLERLWMGLIDSWSGGEAIGASMGVSSETSSTIEAQVFVPCSFHERGRHVNEAERGSTRDEAFI